MKPGQKILGHIDCPTCGTKGGMRITSDKNGDPFGYCEAECGQQLRVGGDASRVRHFLARFPWANHQGETAAATPSKNAAEPVAEAAEKPKAKPRSVGFFDALLDERGAMV